MIKALCWILGHKYKVCKKIGSVGNYEYLLKCTCCNEFFLMNTFVKAVLPVDDDFIQYYKISGFDLVDEIKKHKEK